MIVPFGAIVAVNHNVAENRVWLPSTRACMVALDWATISQASATVDVNTSDKS